MSAAGAIFVGVSIFVITGLVSAAARSAEREWRRRRRKPSTMKSHVPQGHIFTQHDRFQ